MTNSRYYNKMVAFFKIEKVINIKWEFEMKTTKIEKAENLFSAIRLISKTKKRAKYASIIANRHYINKNIIGNWQR